MGVIMKMKMPRSCIKCPFCKESSPVDELSQKVCDNQVSQCYEQSVVEYAKKRHPDCPFIDKIPDKHGDLIDRDKLVPDIMNDWNGYCVPPDEYSQDYIEGAPVVVKATE